MHRVMPIGPLSQTTLHGHSHHARELQVVGPTNWKLQRSSRPIVRENYIARATTTLQLAMYSSERNSRVLPSHELLPAGHTYLQTTSYRAPGGPVNDVQRHNNAIWMRGHRPSQAFSRAWHSGRVCATFVLPM